MSLLKKYRSRFPQNFQAPESLRRRKIRAASGANWNVISRAGRKKNQFWRLLMKTAISIGKENRKARFPKWRIDYEIQSCEKDKSP